MPGRKRKRDVVPKTDTAVSVSPLVALLRSGDLSILGAIKHELPEVFAAETLPKLDMKATLNLAQVNKEYNKTVWSVDGVRSMEAKIKAYVQNIERREMFTEPMIWAAKYGNLPAVRALLKDGVGIDKSLNMNKWTVLHVAAFYNHAALVKELIKAGADVNMRVCADVKRAGTDPGLELVSNYTALHLAAVTSHTTIIMELIKGGADVNIATSDGVTPLHIAADVGHEAGVLALMYAGADINAVVRNGHTPLSAAVHGKHERIVELLKHAGAVETRSPGL